MRNFNSKSGTVLIVSVVLMLTIAALGMSYTMTSVSTSNSIKFNYAKNRALSLAEAAIEQGLFDLTYKKSDFPLPTDGNELIWKDATNSTEIKHPNGGTYSIKASLRKDADGNVISNQGILSVTATYDGYKRSLSVVIYNDSNTTTEHELFYKAIYAGNKSGKPNYTFELTGKSTSSDNVRGAIHIEGNIITSLNGHATINSGNNETSATGTIKKVDAIGNPISDIPNTTPASDNIKPPILDLANYTKASNQYKSWDPTCQGEERSVVWVNSEFEEYQKQGKVQTVKISCEDSTKISGTNVPYWNSSATVPPDESAANFFMQGYQNHFAKSFTYSDDQKISQSKNFYLGQRNGGTSSKSGNNNGMTGGYGGGHSVIMISKSQNNKVYYVDGNLWIDSDGSNHMFFVPGPDMKNTDGTYEPIRITFVAKGNIYIGDQIFVHGDNESKTNSNEGSSDLNDWEAVDYLNKDSAIALIAMADGESYVDNNKNGKYDVGEDILGRDESGEPKPATNNPVADGAYSGSDYKGRLEGSGNVVFGDTINGPVGSVEAFMYADNNFDDITSADANDQAAFVLGNMTGGNQVNLDRNKESWEDTSEYKTSLPSGWIAITTQQDGSYTKDKNGNYITYYYPAGTKASDVKNPLIVTRRIQKSSNTKWKIYARKHTPLNIKLDSRIIEFSGGEKPFLPGLPSSTKINIKLGSWKPVMWLNK